MTEVRPADQAARDRALDVTGSFIVQAPAGSGKTELLIQRCLALLATLETPESLLAITFTRKAAAEMRERILGALRDATEETGNDGRTHQLASAALAADRKHGWGLLANPSRLRIQTIDALNLGLARRLPVLSGLGHGLDVEEHAEDLYRLAAARLLTQLADGEPAHAHSVAVVLAHLDNRVQLFLDLIVEILRGREAWLPVLPGASGGVVADAQLRITLERARSALVTGHLTSLHRAFAPPQLRDAAALAHQAAQDLQRAGLDSPILDWQGDGSVPDTTAASVPRWVGLAELLLTKKGTPRGSFDYRQGFPQGPAGEARKARARRLCEELRRDEELAALLHAVRRLPAPAYEAAEWTVVGALLTVLRLAAAELEVVFAEQRVADYPRFAAAARAALGEPEAPTDTALALDARLQHLLVDEFQDTSVAQVRLLEALTAGWQPMDGRTLFLVGDPMQSIYRFRDAEVGLFLDVRDRGLGPVRLERIDLGVNFRSTRPLIAWLNQAFPRILPERDDMLRGAVAYLPVAAGPDAAAEGGVWLHASPANGRLDEARLVVDVAERRLAESRDSQVAILVQSRNHLVHIVAELTRRACPFRATDIDPLAERPVVLDLLALARALAHAGDRTAWLSVLRAPWCGLTLAELHALCAGEPDRAVIDLLRDGAWRRALDADAAERLERTHQSLEQALSELRPLGLRDTVERLWHSLGGPATLADALSLDEAEAFLEVLADAERRDGPALDLAALSRALLQLYASSLPDPTVRIELLTIHKAKGLQFDTVIVPGLDQLPRGDERRLLRWTTQITADHTGLVVAPLAKSGGARNQLYDWLKEREQEKLLQERRRLLYVAATRARSQLHLFGSCELRRNEDGPTVARPRAASMLGMLWPVVAQHFAAQLAECDWPKREADSAPARDPPLRRLPVAWRPPAPPPAPRISAARLPHGTALPAVTFDWVSQTARHVGTVVHRELQRLASRTPLPAFDTELPHARFADELAELGVPAELRGAAIERVSAAVRGMLADERGRWLLDAGHAESVTELALSGRIGGELLHVVIDRSFVGPDGLRWVIDYKLSPHEGGGLEEFLDREQRRYALQLARYAELARRIGPEPVRVGLYFPLQGAWRDWSPQPD
jgi:ATP-dependent exoDNAse (exonuclease V) beta subunit